VDIEESSNAYVKLEVASGGSAKVVPVKELTIVEQIKEFTIGNDKVRYTRGNQSFDLTINGVAETFKIFYNYYEGKTGDGQNSGAYIFRPVSQTSKTYSEIKKSYYADGQGAGIIILEGDRILTRVYFSKAVDAVRNFGLLIETQIDSIPINDNIGKEVTLNIKTNKKNNNIFTTDSMGLEEQKRVIDFRPTWNYSVQEPTSGNYYPINSFISMKDASNNRTVTLLTDRSQGGSVLREGEFEIMIHRRLLDDDHRGVVEPLNEIEADGQGLRQTVRHALVFGNEYRAVQMMDDQRIQPTFAKSQSNSFSSVSIRKAPITVPSAVKLYLRPFEDGSYLLRLHNMNPVSKVHFIPCRKQ
jgi:lysosomal alpha-mannosidase